MRRAALLLSAPVLAMLLLAAPAVPLAAKTVASAAAPATDPALTPILADPRRDGDRARDAYRRPAETLAFFRVKPGMTVVDYMPSGGWWTRILVPYLGEGGHYIAFGPDVRTAAEGLRRSQGGLAATFPAKITEWTGVSGERIAAFNADEMPAGIDGTVDRALIFREVHNMWRFGWLRADLLAMRRMLKPDGLLGIEQHRARPDAPFALTDGNKGYLREKDVIAMVEAHGFELVAKSELNANPRDPADHANGVWVLPPNFRDGDKDRARLAAIGESDRMMLLFRKRP